MKILNLKSLSLLAITILYIFCNNAFAYQSKVTDSGYISVADGKLYYEKFGATSSTPIIILHGGPGLDSSYLLPQMAQLADGNEVIFYDQRGSGKSLGFALNAQTINVDKFVNDLETVRSKLGNKKIILLGHSWGGLLAMLYAIQHPDNVTALILVSAAPSNSNEFQQFFASYVKRIQPLKETLEKIQASTKFKEGDAVTVKKYFYLIFTEYFYDKNDVKQLTLKFTRDAALSGRAVGNIFGETYLSNYDLTPELRRLKMPALIIHGENDIVPVSTARTTNSLIPRSQILVLKECDHFPYIEQPNEFFTELQSFISLHKDNQTWQQNQSL